MKVILLSYEYPPRIGGEGSYTEGLAISLNRIGFDVEVVTSGTDGENPRPDEGPRIVGLAGIERRPLSMASFQAASSIHISRRCSDADIIHQTNDYFFPLPSRRPVDVLTLSHPYGPEEELVRAVVGGREASAYLRRRHMHYLRSMQRIAGRQIPHIVSISRFTARTFAREHGILPERFRVEHPGVLLDRFGDLKELEEARCDLGLDLSGPLLVHVARLDHNKDLATLLSAMAMIKDDWPESTLLIVGSGPLHGWVTESVKSMDLQKNVHMMGAIRGGKLLDVYAAADLVVLSSLMEGFGIVLAESMAAGRPCVATRCGATEEVVVDGRTGYLVPLRDSSRLAVAISRILAEPGLGRRFGIAGRRRVEREFDWSVLAPRIAAYYEEIQKDIL